MSRQWHEIGVYRGWRLLEVREYRDGDRMMYYSLRTTRELRRKFMNPPYWRIPEFGSANEARAWVDTGAPYKLTPLALGVS